MNSVFRFTLRQMLRQRYLQWILGVMVLLFAVVSWNGARQHIAREQSYLSAGNTMRQAWLGQGAINPHNSAHYGHIVFQPVTAMQVLDQGLRPYAGTMLRLEAHKQNEPALSPAQERTELSRFGDFSLAWVLQVLLPLVVVLMGFSLVSADREQQVLRLIAAQGVSGGSYLAGKVMALSVLSVGLVLTAVAVQYLVYAIMGASGALSASWLISWLGGYMLYAFVLSALSVAVSASVRDSRSSLTLQLAVWAVWMVVLPKMVANLSVRMYPLEHRQQFNKQLAEDRQKGIDGHNPADKHIEAFEDSLLKHYKVANREALPINADGLVMQADEDYSNLVYDKHFGRVRQTLDQQNRLTSLVALINPYMAIRQLSMGLGQSDYRHYLQLVQDAEQYRRVLIRNLNETMAYGGSKTGDWDWAVDTSYWRSVPDFTYRQPPLRQAIAWYWLEGLSLGVWLLVALVWLRYAAGRLFILS